MLAMKTSFRGTFEANCQVHYVPKSLCFINMILHGPNIEVQSNNCNSSQRALSISQLLQINSFVPQRDGENKRERQNRSRETPLPIYVGLTLHAKTQSQNIVDTMHDLGLSISYVRVLDISTDLGNSVCQQHHEGNVVCPPKLCKGLFTTAAVDNIVSIINNPSSTTARDSFHRTGISVFQHPTSDQPGVKQQRTPPTQTATRSKPLIELQETYTVVSPVEAGFKPPEFPARSDNKVKGDSEVVTQSISDDFQLKNNFK